MISYEICSSFGTAVCWKDSQQWLAPSNIGTKIFNSLGQQAYSKEFKNTEAIEIEAGRFVSGIYSVQVLRDNSIRAHNLIIQ